MNELHLVTFPAKGYDEKNNAVCFDCSLKDTVLNTFFKIMLLFLKDTVFFRLLFLSDSVTVKTDT